MRPVRSPATRAALSSLSLALAATLLGAPATIGSAASAQQAGAAEGARDAAPPSAARDTAAPPSIEARTEGMARMEGFFDLYWDEREGKLFWEIDRWDEPFLHQVSLATGLGSNPVGLDRGLMGGTYLLEARRVGPKVLLIEPNHRYRATSDDPAEVRAVTEAFAPSTRWGFPVEAQTGERVLVDATPFFLRDPSTSFSLQRSYGVAGALEEAGQGSFELDPSRSVVHLPRTKAFPENTEVEVSLTFTSDEPGPLVEATAASGDAFTLRVHHSLVRPPEPGFETRPADPRVGALTLEFQDYATPIAADVQRRWVTRFRLEKEDPTAERSPAVEPIVFHLDPGVPEPIRSALLEGAGWWNQAFEAAGYEDAFRVEMLPEDADPMDLRYNVIHWTHRRTRGWSYGFTVVDPRTGEILKGNVNLGSLRLRQDHLLGEGLAPGVAGRGLAAAGALDGTGAPGDACAAAAGPGAGHLARLTQADPTELALARVRQLAAHEVGHAIGLAHNFIASTYAGRASVMDYPAPLVRIADGGTLDLSDAYDTGIGEYDAFAVRWLYADVPEGEDEAAVLEAIVDEGLESGMRFVSDADARPAGAAHPLANLWDNGSDPVAMLEREMEVRRIGLEAFGEETVDEGEPLSSLEGVLVPLYLHHRYQLEAAIRSVGGVDYRYAVRGDGRRPLERVAADRQRAALDAVLETLTPSALALPERLLELIPPPAYASADQERFSRRTGPTLDPLSMAASAADFTAGLLLHPERLARVARQHAHDAGMPGVEEVSDRLLDATWRSGPAGDGYLRAVDEEVERVVLDRLIEAAEEEASAPAVRATLADRLDALADWLAGREAPTAHQRQALRDLRRWQDRAEGEVERPAPAELPPGSPIGGR